MSVQHFKVVGLVVLLLGLIGGLMFGIHVKADPLVIGVFGTAIGAGTTVAFRWFTSSNGGDDKAGPAAVLLVAGSILAAGDGCALPAQAASSQAEDAYRAEQRACVHQFETREQILACREKVREAWGIVDADGGAQ